MPFPKFYLNVARCKKCGDKIVSKHRHDFVWCSCRTIFVDGGNDYRRAGGSFTQFDRDFNEVWREFNGVGEWVIPEPDVSDSEEGED